MPTPYALTFLHEHVRTVSVNPPVAIPEGNRIVKLDGSYPSSATDSPYGVTINDRNRPGNRLALPTVPAITVRAYAKNDRFSLTAAQAANVGGKAGIYQVSTAFTPAATTLSTAEAANVFYVGAALQSNYLVDNASTTPVFDVYTSTYQRDVAVCIRGIVVVEVGANVAAGGTIVSDNQGRAIASTGAAGEVIIGTALDAGKLGDFIRLELRVR